MNYLQENSLKLLSESCAGHDEEPYLIRPGHDQIPGWDNWTITLDSNSIHKQPNSQGHFPIWLSDVHIQKDADFEPAKTESDDLRTTPQIETSTAVSVVAIKSKSVIGRLPDVSSIELDGKYVSRKHAQFIEMGGVWAIRDLSSSMGTVVNGILAQSKGASTTSLNTNKRSFSQASLTSLHHSFSKTMSQSLDQSMSHNSEESYISQITLKPNQLNEITIGSHKLFITPPWRLSTIIQPSLEYVDSRCNEWPALFGSSESFWYCDCKDCRTSTTTRVAIAKFAPVVCELRYFERNDFADIVTRKQLLEPIKAGDAKCLERVLAINEGTNPFIVSLAPIGLDQITARMEAFQPIAIVDFLQELLTALKQHKIHHGSISGSTILLDEMDHIYLYGFMRPLELRKLGHDAKDIFQVFRTLEIKPSDDRLTEYLLKGFNSAVDALEQLPTPDVEFDNIVWEKNLPVDENFLHPSNEPVLSISQICESAI